MCIHGQLRYKEFRVVTSCSPNEGRDQLQE